MIRGLVAGEGEQPRRDVARLSEKTGWDVAGDRLRLFFIQCMRHGRYKTRCNTVGRYATRCNLPRGDFVMPTSPALEAA